MSRGLLSGENTVLFEEHKTQLKAGKPKGKRQTKLGISHRMLRFQPSSLTQFPNVGSRMFILQVEDQKAPLWAAQEEGSGSIQLESTQQNGPTYSEGHPQAQSSSQLLNTYSKYEQPIKNHHSKHSSPKMNNEPKAKRTEKKGVEKQEIWQKITQETEKIFKYPITNIFLNIRSFKKINKTRVG